MASEEFFTWFRNSSTKTRPGKFHFFLRDTGCQAIHICREKIENTGCKKVYFLGIS